MSTRASSVTAREALFRAQVTVLGRLHEDFPTGEISLNEYDVLFNLSRQPEHRLRIRDLNRHLLITQPSISRPPTGSRPAGSPRSSKTRMTAAARSCTSQPPATTSSVASP